jgi:hypothetical protein
MNNNKNIVQKVKNSIWSRVVLGAMLVGMSMSSQASFMNLVLEDLGPDITSGFIDLDYNSSTNELTAVGEAITLSLDPDVYSIEGITSFYGEFNLIANIDENGELTTGSFNIFGKISNPELNFTSGLLLSGSLSFLGFENGVGSLNFLFNVDDGDAKDLYGGIGGIILGATGFKDWNTDFSTTSAIADTGVPVPEPTSIWLLGSALVGFAGLARRKQKK